MKYIGENAIKKLISLIKGDLATKQDSIAATGVLERDTTGVINGVETVGATLVETQEATLVDVPNGLLKGDGTTISAAVAGTDYVNSSQAIRYDAAQPLTDTQKTQARNNIAAAPDGFGLGGNAKLLTSADNLDNIKENGWYWWYDTRPSGAEYNYCHMKVDNGQTGILSSVTQTIYRNSMNSVTIRFYDGNTWITEYINPPMQIGVEYRTQERYLGKPVYVKAVECGAMPASTFKNVEHGIENISAIISCTGYFKYGNNSLTSLPYARGTVTTVGSIWANETNIVVWMDNSDYTNYNAYGIIKCTKNTD